MWFSRKRIGIAVLAVACPIAAVSAVTSVQNQDIDGVPLHSPPPLESFVRLDDAADLFHMTAAGDDGEVIAELRYDTLEKRVSLNWSWGSTGGEFDEPLAREVTSISLSYWPTAARYLGGGKIAVAGKSSVNGLPIIEVWTLTQPSVVSVGSPPAYFLRAGRLTDRRLAFVSPPSSGLGLVRALWRNRGLDGERVFALSFENRDIYSIDLASGTASLAMADDQPVGPAPAEPMLQPFWNSYSGPYRHATHGDLYGLTNEGDVVSSGSEVHTLYLVDANKDGVLDSSLEVSADQEEALGLHDASLWE